VWVCVWVCVGVGVGVCVCVSHCHGYESAANMEVETRRIFCFGDPLCYLKLCWLGDDGVKKAKRLFTILQYAGG